MTAGLVREESKGQRRGGRGMWGGKALESERSREGVPPPSLISCVALGRFISFFVSFLKWVS